MLFYGVRKGTVRGEFMPIKLYEYQDKAINFILYHKRCALFMGMGLGKTIITLTAISRLIKNGTSKKVLIIAPLRVARTVWHEEALKSSETSHLSFSLALGTKKEREKGLFVDADITVINKENVTWLCATQKWSYDTVIIDESTSFKNSKSKCFRSLRGYITKANVVVLLTGTPASNGIMDLWSQMYLLDQGKRLGRTKGEFIDRYFSIHNIHRYTVYKPRRGAEQRVLACIRDICISQKAESKNFAIDKVVLTYYVTFTESERKTYKELTQELITSIDGNIVVAASECVNANKLRQLCNGFAYCEDGITAKFHSKKIEVIQELVDENPTENFLIAYGYKEDKRQLLDSFNGARVLESAKDISDWNAGNIKILLAHPASAGHGLNLQYGGSLVVWFGLPWSREHYDQFNARLYRNGQTKIVRIIHIVAKDCIDERIVKVLNQKGELNKNIMTNFNTPFL